MDNFSFFLRQGLSHITDIGAYDHILFIIALVAFYSIKEWKALILLVTCFTIGHSVALALATFDIVAVNSGLVEFLIPVTIILTCLANLARIAQAHLSKQELKKEKTTNTKYAIVIFFGIVHGLGFSNFLAFMLASDESIFLPLLSFNIGLEIGQLAILSIALLINFVFLELLKIPTKYWSALVSISVLLISIPILLDTGNSLFFER